MKQLKLIACLTLGLVLVPLSGKALSVDQNSVMVIEYQDGRAPLRIPTESIRQITFSPQHSGVTVSPPTTPAPPPPSQPIVLKAGLPGTYSWVAGQTLVVKSNGTIQVFLNGKQINSGTWKVTNAGRREFQLRHNSGGWVDNITLSADGKTITGTNNVGSRLHGVRIKP